MAKTNKSIKKPLRRKNIADLNKKFWPKENVTAFDIDAVHITNTQKKPGKKVVKRPQFHSPADPLTSIKKVSVPKFKEDDFVTIKALPGSIVITPVELKAFKALTNFDVKRELCKIQNIIYKGFSKPSKQNGKRQ